jgi:hypothetical protein
LLLELKVRDALSQRVELTLGCERRSSLAVGGQVIVLAALGAARLPASAFVQRALQTTLGGASRLSAISSGRAALQPRWWRPAARQWLERAARPAGASARSAN